MHLLGNIIQGNANKREECSLRYYATLHAKNGDRGSTVVKMLCYKSEGRWFDLSWCQWIFH